MGVIVTDVQVNIDGIVNKLQRLNNDDTIMLAIHNAFARYMNPYVPMDSGALSQGVEITPKCVRYTSPYAHYQYEGIVYAPNLPIVKNGVIVGWYSPPEKYPTGREINYSHEQHPLATHHWDKAMMRDRGDEFKTEVKDIVEDYLNG